MERFEHKIPEIQEFLNRHRVTSQGRRNTVHVTDRGKTAIGLIRAPGTPLRTTFLAKRTSITPTSRTKSAIVSESSGSPAQSPNRRHSNDVKSPRTPTSKVLKKALSESLYDRRASVNFHQTPFLPNSPKKGALIHSSSRRHGEFTHMRRKSRGYSDFDYDNVKRKVTYL